MSCKSDWFSAVSPSSMKQAIEKLKELSSQQTACKNPLNTENGAPAQTPLASWKEQQKTDLTK